MCYRKKIVKNVFIDWNDEVETFKSLVIIQRLRASIQDMIVICGGDLSPSELDDLEVLDIFLEKMKPGPPVIIDWNEEVETFMDLVQVTLLRLSLNDLKEKCIAELNAMKLDDLLVLDFFLAKMK